MVPNNGESNGKENGKLNGHWGLGFRVVGSLQRCHGFGEKLP